jgi:hypothetical protein
VRVALKLHWVPKSPKTLRFRAAGSFANNGDCVRARTRDVRNRRLENRRSFTELVGSNPTLSSSPVGGVAAHGGAINVTVGKYVR